MSLLCRSLALMKVFYSTDDINGAKIRYRMAKESSNLQDSFQFDVMDRKPNVVPGNQFHIMWSEISIGLSFFNITETQRVLQVPVVRRGNLKQVSLLVRFSLLYFILQLFLFYVMFIFLLIMCMCAGII